MNKLNEDLEVKINEEISKSFDVTAQIFDELNDIEVVFEKYRRRRQQSAAINKARSPQVKITSPSVIKEKNIFEVYSDHISNEVVTAQPILSENDFADKYSHYTSNKQRPSVVDCFPAIDGMKSDKKLVLKINVQSNFEQSRLLEGYREYKIKLSEQPNRREQEENNSHHENNETQSYFSKMADSVSGFISKQ